MVSKGKDVHDGSKEASAFLADDVRSFSGARFRKLFDDVETLRKIFVRRDEREEAQADAKAAELLEKSPYKERLKDAGLFLRAMSDRIRFLPELLRPHLGNSMVRGSEVVRLAGIMQAAPEVELKRRDQIAALPLGARLRLNPWNNTISMASPTTAPLNSQREKAAAVGLA